MKLIYQGMDKGPPPNDIARHADLLNEVLAESSDSVTATWNRQVDARDRELFSLTLQNAYGQATSSFTVDELHYPSHMRVRLHQLWGKVLRAYTDRLLLNLRNGD